MIAHTEPAAAGATALGALWNRPRPSGRVSDCCRILAGLLALTTLASFGRAADEPRPVRRIEVKGRLAGQPVRLTVNEWLKARQLAESYWLYVVWNPTSLSRELVTVVDPGHRLEHLAQEVRAVSHFELPADAVRSVSTQP